MKIRKFRGGKRGVPSNPQFPNQKRRSSCRNRRECTVTLVFNAHSKVRHQLNKARMTWTLPVIAVLLLPNGLSAQWKTPWTYEGKTGAEHWGELDPAYALCNTGKEQSPVDIRNAEKADLPPLRFEYTSGPLKHLINNGYAIRVNYHEDSDS